MACHSEALLFEPFQMIDHLIHTARYCSHFTNEGNEAKRGQGTSLRPRSKLGAIEDWDSRFFAAQADTAFPPQAPTPGSANSPWVCILPECKAPLADACSKTEDQITALALRSTSSYFIMIFSLERHK